MKKYGFVFLAAPLLVFSLSACGSVKKEFDFSKKAPDEFAVVKRAPLEMPNDLSRLPPPQPGAPRPQEQSTDQMARQSVLGSEGITLSNAPHTSVSQGEAALLQRTGGATASPAIRAAVDKESAEISEKQSPGIDKLKKMVGMTVEPPAKVVDPVAEINRLRANKAQGKPVTDGKTPTLER